MSFSHVLISRPEPQCSELAELLRAHGLAVVAMPAFGFEAVGFDWPPGAAWDTAQRRLAIFTSPRSVAYALPALPQGALDGVEIAAIGPATAEALSARGIAVDLQPSGAAHSEALLADPSLAGRPGAVALFAAPGGRDALRQGLADRAWAVMTCHAYRRVACAPEAGELARLADAQSILSAWTSGTAMDLLLDSFPPPLREKALLGCLLVVSGRLRDKAEHLGATRIELAKGADNANLAESLLRLALESTGR